jgi:hypothetical protein
MADFDGARTNDMRVAVAGYRGPLVADILPSIMSTKT